MPELLVFVAIALAIALVFSTLKALVIWYALKHQHPAPRGQFKITMPADKWDSQMRSGAMAVAITDARGQVYMTLVVQREAKK